jgi:chemotaxis protein MotB
MRLFFYLLILAFIPSCVTSKKYKQLESIYIHGQDELKRTKNLVDDCSKNNLMLEQKLLSANYESQLKDQKIETLKKEHFYKDEKIREIEDNLIFVKTSNVDLSKRMDELSTSNKLNVDIMKKLLEEAEVQHLKVLNLSLALQKQDSLNIHLVKRTKKNISDKKLKKSLEKLGFVFY